VSIRPIHIAYRVAQRLRMLWWRVARPHVYGAKVVVLGPERSVLLIRHSYVASAQWMLPGGGVRRGEDAAEAAVREVLEETGVVLSAIRLHGEFLDSSRGARNHISIFVAEGAGKARCDGREIVAAEWHSLDALPDRIASGSLKRIVEVRDGRPPAGSGWP
jgi:8-oxo-dGTP pyrophosphatase MutT (NUDIX family)